MRDPLRRELWSSLDSYRRLGCRQTPLPADVDGTRGDDGGADRPDHHQNHEQFAVVAALLAGREGAAGGAAEVLDANLRGGNIEIK